MSTLDVTTADPRAAVIGGRIRRLRHARGLTLVRLAEEAELSHPFLSQLERGLARPSIGSLEKIARALGTSQLELLAEDADARVVDDAPVSLVRSGAGARGVYGNGDGRMLAAGRRPFLPMEFTGDNVDPGDFVLHAEDEFLHVLEGRVEVDLGAQGRHLLGPGDSLYYAGGTAHRWYDAAGGAGYRLIVVKERPRV